MIILNNNDVIIKYKRFDNNHPIMSEIQFELVENTILKLIYDENAEEILICMSDSISDNLELEGRLNPEKINTLIKALSQLKNQIHSKDVVWR